MKSFNKLFQAIGLSVAVTGLLFFMLLTQLAVKISGDTALEPILALTVSSQKQDIYTLSYDPNGKTVNWVVADTVPKPASGLTSEQVVRFALPNGEITRLRLELGTMADTVLIRSISIITKDGNTCTWKGSELTRFFPQSDPHLGQLEIRSNLTWIEITGETPYMIADPFEMENVCNRESTLSSGQQVRWWMVAALVCGLLGFGLYQFLKRGATVWELALISGFMLLIALPLITQVIGVGKTVVSAENRALSTAPGLPVNLDDLKRYPARWSAYFSDHFGGRNEMIFWGNQLKVRVLKTSPVPTVILGKDKWLYYAGDMAGMDYQGLVEIPKTDLKRIDKYLKGVREELADRGIEFLVVIAPDKQSVYPEHMPNNIQRGAKPTRADQFLNYNANHANIDVLDLRPVLVEKKSQAAMDIFYKTDTHWNFLGAFYAYQAIVDRLSAWFPGLTPHPLSDYKLVTGPKPGNDLAKITMMRTYFMDTEVRLQPNFTSPVKRVPLDYPGATLRQSYATEIDDPNLPRLVMFHDSYAPFFNPYLAEHFERAAFIWTYNIDWDLIDQEKPDLVILEVVERQIHVFAPAP